MKKPYSTTNMTFFVVVDEMGISFILFLPFWNGLLKCQKDPFFHENKSFVKWISLIHDYKGTLNK